MIPGIFNQGVRTPDCWVFATKWAAEASRPGIRQPSLTEFRRHAGDPRDGINDGGSLDEVMAGAKGSWPDLTIARFDADWDLFKRQLDLGHPASLALLSGLLAPYYQYGFLGPHQVGVIASGLPNTYYLANPLAPDGSQPRLIAGVALQKAATALYAGGKVRAALFPVPEDHDVPGLSTTAVAPTRTGVFRVKAKTEATFLHDRTRDPLPAGAVRRAIGPYKRDWDDAPGYLITESTRPSWIPANAGTFTPDVPAQPYTVTIKGAGKEVTVGTVTLP